MGVILASYLGSWLMAGSFLAIGSAVSAVTKSQVIAFVVSGVICFLFTLSGSPLILGPIGDWLPSSVVGTISGMSFLTHFAAIARGLVDLRDLVFFVSVIALFLFANTVIVELKKAD